MKEEIWHLITDSDVVFLVADGVISISKTDMTRIPISVQGMICGIRDRVLATSEASILCCETPPKGFADDSLRSLVLHWCG